MENSQKDNTIKCPECDSPLIIKVGINLGQIIECNKCGTESEIIDTNPFKLAPLEEEK